MTKRLATQTCATGHTLDLMARLTEFSREGLDFDLHDQGPLGGEPVVLLHGFPQDARAYDSVVPLLHVAGLRTLCPDQRGYSPRARPPGRSAYRLGALVEDVAALIEVTGSPSAHLVGHDWGGAVAWALAGGHPERVRSLTVLSTPHPRALARAAARSDQLWRSRYMLGFQLPWLPERLLADRDMAEVLRRTGLPRELGQNYAARMAEPGALTATLHWYRAMPWSARTPVPPVEVPTTFVWGTRDFALGRYAALATGRFVTGDYRFVELDGGHWLPERQPEEVAAAIIDRVLSEPRGTVSP